MKILHCCLAAFYIDRYGYQENILPKIHKIDGHEVQILASTETYVNNHLEYINPSKYINENGIIVQRIGYVKWIPKKIVRKLRVYNGTYKVIKEFQPDIIFLHDIQFLSIISVIKYVKKNPKVKIYADGHTDFINSAKNWLSKNILHKIIYRWCAKQIEPYVSKFWGVTPLRMDFFVEMYKINPKKVDLLVMGVDDSIIDFTCKDTIRNKIRSQFNIKPDDFVLISGGKIDKRKNIHLLIQAINELNNKNIKLILFGIPDDEMKEEVKNLLDISTNIITLGWITPSEVYDYFFASDLGFFPGTHSVLWEQAVGLGLPCVFKKWKGMQHVDVGGNCLFLEQGTKDEIKQLINKVYIDDIQYENMKRMSEKKGKVEFSYKKIGKKSIEEI